MHQKRSEHPVEKFQSSTYFTLSKKNAHVYTRKDNKMTILESPWGAFSVASSKASSVGSGPSDE